VWLERLAVGTSTKKKWPKEKTSTYHTCPYPPLCTQIETIGVLDRGFYVSRSTVVSTARQHARIPVDALLDLSSTCVHPRPPSPSTAPPETPKKRASTCFNAIGLLAYANFRGFLHRFDRLFLDDLLLTLGASFGLLTRPNRHGELYKPTASNFCYVLYVEAEDPIFSSTPALGVSPESPHYQRYV
jgi:hypothetical protein